MTYALVALSFIQLIIHAIEISVPHKVQQLLVQLKTDPDHFELDSFSKLYSFLPLVHIPFIILLFLSDVPRFFYYGIYFVASLFFEGYLIQQILKQREVVTLLALVNFIINIDIIRSLLF